MKIQSERDVDFTIYTTVFNNGNTEWRKVVDSDPEIGTYHVMNYHTCEWETFFTLLEAHNRVEKLKELFSNDFSKVATYEPDYFDDEGWE